ncbi:MAG: CHASE domain-containing protein [Aminivibrio sp.]|jgi:PAS domain S-box-containing protein
MNRKASWFKRKSSDGVFLKLTRNLIIFSLLAAFFLTFENSYREEARLKRELTDWGAQIARGMGEKTPSCADRYELEGIREHFSALKRIYPPLRAVRFIDLDNEGNPLLRVCSESSDKDAPALSRPLPEELRAAATRAAKERKAEVVMPYGPRRGKGIAVFAPLGHGRYSGMDAALLLDLDPSLVSERIWKAARLPLAAVAAICLLAIFGGAFLRGAFRSGGPARGGGKAEALIASLAFGSIAFAFYFSYLNQSAAQSDLIFYRIAERRANQMGRLLNNSCTVKLETLASFMRTRDSAGENEFAAFTEFMEDDPLVKGWEWALAVKGAERPAFEAKVRSEGRPGFALWEKDGSGGRTVAGERDNYYIVTYVLPREIGEGATGFDMGSEPVRNRTMSESIATGRTLATDPVTLVQDSGEEKGLLILKPVFNQEAGIKGFVIARLALSELLAYSESMSRDDGAGVSIAEIYLARGGDQAELLACSAAGHECKKEGGGRQSEGAYLFPLSVFGKTLIVAVHRGGSFNAVYPPDRGFGILIAGFFLVYAVYSLVSALAARGEALEELVEERTAALREREGALKEAQEIARLGSWVLDVPSGVLTWSDQVYRLFGLPFGSPQTYAAFLEAVHPDDREGLDAAYSSSVAEGLEKYEYEHRVINRETGEILYLHEQCRHYRDETGKIVRSMGMVQDITERKLSEMALKKAGAELASANASLEAALAEARELAQKAEAANVAKGQFLANVSHEIRTPLNGVIGLADILGDTPLTDEQREYTALLKSSGRHLLDLIDDVLDFSKLGAGKLMLREEEFCLREFMEEIFASGAARASIKGLGFSGGLSPEAPKCILGDRFRIRQILANLLDNAVKFTDEGAISVTVSVEGTDEEGRSALLFRVADTGTGVSEEDLGRLFTEFSQVDPTLTRQHGGTGLGLAISKELAGLMGGEIGASSPSGLDGGGPGSEFWFTVKITEVSCLEEEGKPAPAAGRGTVVLPEGLKVLVAEDNSVNRRVIAAILMGAGIESDFAEDGAGALAALEKSRYDAVFMDVQMPVMDGLEATRLLRQAEREGTAPPVPVIALTAHAMPGDREMCMEAGMDEYLSKPIDRRIFLETLARVVSGAGRPAEGTGRTPEKELKVFDPEFLLENLGGDREAVADILADFAAEIPAELAAIRERAGAGDAEQAARHAHTLKGAAGGIGGEKVRELAFRAEKAGREGDLEALLSLLPELEQAFADLEAALARRAE